MADLAWSEKRKAMIPGQYQDGFFVPFNGDEPIPQEKVFASKPPMRIPAKNDRSEIEEMSLSEAFGSGHRRDMRRAGKFAKWWFGGMAMIALAWILMSPKAKDISVESKPEPEVASENDYGTMNLSPGLVKLEGMSVDVLAKFGDKKGIDCSSDASLVTSLQKVQDRVFSPSTTVAYGVRKVEIEGGSATLVGFRRLFMPGDRDATSVAGDFYLVNGDCQSLPLT